MLEIICINTIYKNNLHYYLLNLFEVLTCQYRANLYIADDERLGFYV